MPEAGGTLLEVAELRKYFPAERPLLGKPRTWLKAVDGVSFAIRKGESFGLLGESGCGKSTLAKLMVRLLPVTSGRILYDGKDITHAEGEELRAYRREAQLIFQDPFASLNPRMTVETLLTEGMRAFGWGNRRSRRERAAQLLRLVGLDPQHLDRYPHEFSGGQRQRIGIARALALEPKLIVADEPVSALDVSVQAQILNLLLDLREGMGLSYVFIAHDPEVIRVMTDRVAVMYLGRIVELGPTESVLVKPRHPYTEALLAAAPKPEPGRRRRRAVLRGDVPSPVHVPPGCPFHPRCPKAEAVCREEVPKLAEVAAGRLVACCLAGDEAN